MTIGSMLQIAAIFTFVVGFCIFAGGGIVTAATSEKKSPSQGFFDASFLLGSTGAIMFCIGTFLNNMKFFI